MKNYCTARLLWSTLEEPERRIWQRRDATRAVDSAAGMAGAAPPGPFADQHVTLAVFDPAQN
jgi:hypothetical protein